MGKSKDTFCKDCFILEIKCSSAISYLKLGIKKSRSGITGCIRFEEQNTQCKSPLNNEKFISLHNRKSGHRARSAMSVWTEAPSIFLDWQSYHASLLLGLILSLSQNGCYSSRHPGFLP